MAYDLKENPWMIGLRRPEPPPAVMSEALARMFQTSAGPSPGLASVSPPVQERSVIEKIADATGRMREQIADGKLNRNSQLQWVARLIFLLKPIFGKQSPLMVTLEQLRNEIGKTQLSSDDFISRVEQVEHFLCSFNAAADAGSFVLASRRSLIPATNDVFVIHGRDETNQLRLSKLIREDFKLTPIVILDKPGRSAPTIDKFEHHAQTCSYAIALFTADDRVITKHGEEYWQPRPNVIFEIGWFVGRLGKERVLILLQEGVKTYSDFDGVNRIQFRDDVEDKFRAIRAELRASGLISSG
jgi:CAP12/Pycsar effector protein, TIR domain